MYIFNKFSKILSLGVCVLLLSTLMISPAVAVNWTPESFTGDFIESYNYYDFEPPVGSAGSPVKFSLTRDVAVAVSDSVTSADFQSFFNFLPPTSVVSLSLRGYIPDSELLAWDVWPDSPVGLSGYTSATYLGSTVSFSNIPTTAYSDIYDESFPVDSWYIDTSYNPTGLGGSSSSVSFSIDISSYGSFKTFSLSGSVRALSRVRFSDNSTTDFFADKVDLYVNDSLVDSFYPNSNNGSFDFGDKVYSYSSPVTSIKFVCDYGSLDLVNVKSGNDTLRVYFMWSNYRNFLFTVLSENDALNGFNDNAQNELNNFNSTESEWTGSMTDNFNSLSLDTFSFPNGLVSAFGLITGIFNDLWNGMGEYRVTYVFPLTLALVLLVIGRISKFAGGQSSSKQDRGDSSA